MMVGAVRGHVQVPLLKKAIRTSTVKGKKWSLQIQIYLNQFDQCEWYDYNKRSGLFSFLKNLNSYIYLLQETHGISRFDDWEVLSFLNPGATMSCGVTILLSPNFKAKILACKLDFEGRVLVLSFLFELKYLI